MKPERPDGDVRRRNSESISRKTLRLEVAGQEAWRKSEVGDVWTQRVGRCERRRRRVEVCGERVIGFGHTLKGAASR